MEENLVKVVVDTNVFISGIIFGGKPKTILELVYTEKIQAVISATLLSELQEILLKKFKFSESVVLDIEERIKDIFKFVYPTEQIMLVKDEDDNRILEAAMEGNCDFIITGDKELLHLHQYKGIVILSSDEFLARWKGAF